ncbi:hypothetical protein BDY21DRAFT_107260 [Lineolata rhizophorae]|uniref:Ubiquitin-like domain-containing protein n=1 Tax=Lineolata rhizophorae TaxID=578093 RepID=A0A6A6NRL6_9PEZI|nr:hypothetical protein BDY21DRAFT_107260 [Lineolata rhizophorae]
MALRGFATRSSSPPANLRPLRPRTERCVHKQKLSSCQRKGTALCCACYGKKRNRGGPQPSGVDAITLAGSECLVEDYCPHCRAYWKGRHGVQTRPNPPRPSATYQMESTATSVPPGSSGAEKIVECDLPSPWSSSWPKTAIESGKLTIGMIREQAAKKFGADDPSVIRLTHARRSGDKPFIPLLDDSMTARAAGLAPQSELLVGWKDSLVLEDIQPRKLFSEKFTMRVPGFHKGEAKLGLLRILVARHLNLPHERMVALYSPRGGLLEDDKALIDEDNLGYDGPRTPVTKRKVCWPRGRNTSTLEVGPKRTINTPLT